jgi:APA family basic amino acid/polyamine antiporter
VAEEVKNPKKDLPIGLIGSLSLSTLFYIVVSLVLTGVVNYKELNVPDALSFAMEKLNMHFIASVISIGAVITITSVIMVMGLGFTRVVYALSRDGLLFESLADIHPKFGTPYKATILGAFVLSLAAGLFPLKDLAEMVNIGTLFAYFMVGISIVMIRKSQDYQPKFRMPIAKILLPLNLFTLLLIMAGLPLITWIRFFLWCVVGLLIYIFYGYKHSQLNR